MMSESTPRQLLLGACFAIAFVGLMVALLACSFVVMVFLRFDPASMGEEVTPESMSAFRFQVAVLAAPCLCALLASVALLRWTLRRLIRAPRPVAATEDRHG